MAGIALQTLQDEYERNDEWTNSIVRYRATNGSSSFPGSLKLL